MKLIKKVPSFTLTEILVGLALTTIVVGLSFSVLSIINRNVLGIQSNYYNYSQKLLIEQRLTIDFERFHSIVYDASLDEIDLKTPIDSTKYAFDGSVLLRNYDTIGMISSKTFFYRGIEVNQGQIDAVKLYLDDNTPNSFIFISKQTDAQQKMRTRGN